MPTGIIIKGIGGFYYVKALNSIYECKARGIFRKDDIVPLPGDRVSISISDESKLIGNIEAILPRDSQLVRPAVANVNQIIIVIAAKSPETDFILLDKLLLTAELKGIKAVICINKIDLDLNDEYLNIAKAYVKANYKLILVSSKTKKGLQDLKDLIEGHITVFSGQSGVGKSTILNNIMNSVVMKTGSMSEKIARGKHTTRHAELIGLENGGFIVDTPGFSSFELVDIKYNELELYYPEFEGRLNRCKYTGCSHISEPGCIIKEELDKGSIDLGRYKRYIEFYNNLKAQRDFKTKIK